MRKRGKLLNKFSESIGWLSYRKFHLNIRRSVRGGRITFKDRPRLQMVRREWRHFLVEIYNCLPAEINETNKIGLFKTKIKNWLFKTDEKLFDKFVI